jgi:hypothetical protein
MASVESKAALLIGCCDTYGAFWTFFTFAAAAILTAATVLHRIVARPRADEFEIKHAEAFPKELALPEPDKYKALIGELYVELRLRALASLRMVAVFTQYHYIAIIAAILSGSFGGVAAFVIAAYGWEGVNRAMQGFFVGCAGSLSFWLAVIQVFKYPEIIAKHEAIYVACSNLISELRLARFGLPVRPTDKECKDCCCLVQSIAERAEAIRAIGVSFDSSKIGFARIDIPKATGG